MRKTKFVFCNVVNIEFQCEAYTLTEAIQQFNQRNARCGHKIPFEETEVFAGVAIVKAGSDSIGVRWEQ